MYWSGQGGETHERFPALDTLADEDYRSENMCSLSFRLRYGAFDYYTGGDLTGIPNVGHPDWQNMEKTIADAVGPVDVHVVNHHGSVEPRVLGGAPASRPYRPGPLCKHPAPSVLKRLLSQRAYEGPRDVFILQFREPTKAAIGPRRTRCKAAPATSSCASRPGARPIASSW